MAWARRWKIDSTAKLKRVAAALAALTVDARHPVELLLRSERRDKTAEQRKLFHAVIADLAAHLGLTPAETKVMIKRLFFGAQIKIVRIGDREIPIEVIQSSEELDRQAYSEMIDFTYRLASEQGIALADRRPA